MKKINDIKGFKQFNEDTVKAVVFTFGRFNPPTIGHGKLITKVAAAAIGNQYRIYASQSNDSKKNPLKYKEKIRVMRKMFPKHGRNIIEDKNAKTALHIASILHDQGFTKISMVVGSDRIKEFQKLLKNYNGIKGRHGFYDFKDGIEVISAGERDPDAEGVEGMSASKMRAAAIDGDFKLFSQGLPKEYGEDMTLFNLIRKRMGLKEMVSFRKHVQLPSLSEKREKYISGEIFNVGDIAITESGEEITIKEKKSNYIVDSKNKKHFVEKLKPAYKKGLSKSTSSKRQAQFNKQSKMDDDDPNAYKPAPGDARAKTKVSKHTKAYHKKFGKKEGLDQGTDELVKAYKKLTPLEEKQIAGLKKKAKETGMPYGILKKVFDRGMAAWKTGHRPGATPHQWAFARVNSFVTKSKGTWGGADKDLAAKVRARNESKEDKGRIPRKKGQHTGSSSHSDLYTDEDPEGTIKGLGFKDAETANKSIAIIDKSDRTHAHKVQATLVMQQRSKVAISRTNDPEKKSNLKAANKIYTAHLEKLKAITKKKNESFSEFLEGPGKYKGETWKDGFKRRVVKTTKPEHKEKGYKWRIKGKERDEISIKLYKKKPDFKEFEKQMKRVAGHEFGG
tara:strand:- start:1298 stop:3154 length:1857 start_codon:yes stop_codon:yes gene_type:complete